MKLQELARALRKIAEHVALDELASRPDAFVVVLLNGDEKEVLFSGVQTRGRLREAGRAVIKKSWTAKAAKIATGPKLYIA